MASLLSPRRTDPEIALHATLARPDREPERSVEPDLPRFSWVLAAVGTALATALAGWILVAGLTVVGWLAADPGSFGGAMRVGTQLWLLANGAGARLGGTTLTLMPWGATLLFLFMLSRFAGFTARQTRGRDSHAVVGVTAVMALSYAIPVAGAALVLNGSGSALRGLVVTLVLAALAAGRGSCRGLAYSPAQSWPPWGRAVPRAVLGAQLTMLVCGVLAIGASVVVHVDRVLELNAGLGAGVVGGIALWVAQLAFLPNAVVWAGSYTLGAGFSLGQDSIVTPAATHLGLLPSIPLLGALPSTGPGTMNELWWLVTGVLSGAVAAWVVMRARPRARADETSLVGGLSGVVAGVVFVGLAWASGGDLGTGRLTGVGPRLLPLLFLSPTTMGLAGMLVGLVAGLVRRPGRRRSERTVEIRRRPTGGAPDDPADDAVDEPAGHPGAEETVEVRRGGSEADPDTEPTTQLPR